MKAVILGVTDEVVYNVMDVLESFPEYRNNYCIGVWPNTSVVLGGLSENTFEFLKQLIYAYFPYMVVKRRSYS